MSGTATEVGTDDDLRHGTSESMRAAGIFGGVTVATIAIWLVSALARRDWYDGLEQPWMLSAGPAIGVIWMVLFVPTGAAAWLAWRATPERLPALLWGLLAALHIMWATVVFGLESVGGGVLVVSLMFALAVVASISFSHLSTLAGIVMLVFTSWLAVVFVLNAGLAAENFL